MFGSPKIPKLPPAAPPAAPITPPALQDPTAGTGYVKNADGSVTKVAKGLASLRIERSGSGLNIPK